MKCWEVATPSSMSDVCSMPIPRGGENRIATGTDGALYTIAREDPHGTHTQKCPRRRKSQRKRFSSASCSCAFLIAIDVIRSPIAIFTMYSLTRPKSNTSAEAACQRIMKTGNRSNSGGIRHCDNASRIRKTSGIIVELVPGSPVPSRGSPPRITNSGSARWNVSPS